MDASHECIYLPALTIAECRIEKLNFHMSVIPQTLVPQQNSTIEYNAEWT